MSLRSRTLSLFRNLLGWGRVERELDDEMRSFLEMLAEEKRQAGLTPDAARRAALLELGGLEQVREQARDVRTGATLDALGRDLAYAARTLRKHAGFTAVATATLALGIGASTAVLSVVDTVVFRPLPYRDPDLLVKLCGATPQKTACDDDFSWLELLAARAQSQALRAGGGRRRNQPGARAPGRVPGARRSRSRHHQLARDRPGGDPSRAEYKQVQDFVLRRVAREAGCLGMAARAAGGRQATRETALESRPTR